MKPLVSIDWLNEHFNDKDLVILDASTETNAAKLVPKYPEYRIKGARFFDLKNSFSDQSSEIPNMLPDENVFSQECRKLGLDNSSNIVVYDNLGVYNSPRVWWMFRAMGHEKVAVLDGGLTAWIEAGYEAEPIHENSYDAGLFTSTFNTEFVKSSDEILFNLNKQESMVIDARGVGRFTGEIPEPREGMKSGHIPGSINLPYATLIDGGKFKSKEELNEIFQEQKLANKSLIFTCGSGITACIAMLAAELVIDNKKSIYDGSWAEWGKCDFPIETGS